MRTKSPPTKEDIVMASYSVKPSPVAFGLGSTYRPISQT
jgi:hypothetical protein